MTQDVDIFSTWYIEKMVNNSLEVKNDMYNYINNTTRIIEKEYGMENKNLICFDGFHERISSLNGTINNSIEKCTQQYERKFNDCKKLHLPVSY